MWDFWLFIDWYTQEENKIGMHIMMICQYKDTECQNSIIKCLKNQQISLTKLWSAVSMYIVFKFHLDNLWLKVSW